MNNTATAALKTIKAGQVLTARSICDYECIFRLTVLNRTKSMATVKIDGYVDPKRCKVKVWEGVEYVMALGTHSMAPMFRAA